MFNNTNIVISTPMYRVGTDVTHAYRMVASSNETTADLNDISARIDQEGNNFWRVIGNGLNRLYSHLFSPSPMVNSHFIIDQVKQEIVEKVQEIGHDKFPDTISHNVQDKYQHVYIAGPDAYNLEEVQFFYRSRGINVAVIGDGKSTITPEMLLPLKGRISVDALVFLNFHGKVDHNENHMIMTDTDKHRLTNTFFHVLTGILGDNFKGHIYLGSCYGEAAIKSIKHLPRNAILTTHTGFNTTSSTAFIYINTLKTIYEYPRHITSNTLIHADKITFVRGEGDIHCEINLPQRIPKSPDQLKIHIVRDLSTCNDLEIKSMAQSLNISDNAFKIYLRELSLTYISRGDIGKAEYFLKEKIITPNTLLDHQYNTALIISGQNSYVELARLLMSYSETDPNLQDYKGATALFRAAQEGCIEIVSMLLNDDRTDPNLSYYNGGTPLSIASFNGHDKIVKLLLKDLRVDPTLLFKEGTSPLHVAVRYGHEKSVSELLKDKRINPTLINKGGETPLSIAKSSGNIRIEEILEKGIEEWKRSVHEHKRFKK
ncbi:MAG: ankyrin repeat domain-containing protein [Taibaiella sp.]|jgi:hypothetical protein